MLSPIVVVERTVEGFFSSANFSRFTIVTPIQPCYTLCALLKSVSNGPLSFAKFHSAVKFDHTALVTFVSNRPPAHRLSNTKKHHDSSIILLY